LQKIQVKLCVGSRA